MNGIFAVRDTLHQFKYLQGLYLALASLISLFYVFAWTLSSFQFNDPLIFLLLPLAILHGFLAWFFIPASQVFRIILYTVFFSLLGLLLSKYLFYFHFLHWESAFYIDKSQVSPALLILYLQIINTESLKFFFHEWFMRIRWTDILLVAGIALASIQYRFWEAKAVLYQQSKREKADVQHHVIKRRFR